MYIYSYTRHISHQPSRLQRGTGIWDIATLAISSIQVAKRYRHMGYSYTRHIIHPGWKEVQGNEYSYTVIWIVQYPGRIMHGGGRCVYMQCLHTHTFSF